MTKLQNGQLTEKMLANTAIKLLIESQPINYQALKMIVIAMHPETIDQLLEDGLRYNFEHKFSGSRASAKSILSDEKKEEIKNKCKQQEADAKAAIESNAIEKIVNYTELYDEWTASDGTPIYAMTRTKLFKNADQLFLSASTTKKTAVFYQKLAERLSANTTVRECISSEEYHKIKEEVFQNG